jgi:nitrogen fixation NifU-like protein
MYSAQLLDYFEHPRYPGEVLQPDASAQVENPACGDILRLTVRLDGEKIAEIRFQAKGCVPAMACASALADLLHGLSLSAAAAIRREQLITALGGLPEASSHAGYLAMDALALLLRKLPRK